MLSDVNDVMCLVYVLNELNFCHVFIIICMCQPWIINDVCEVVLTYLRRKESCPCICILWDDGAFAQSDGGAFSQSDGDAY